MAANQVMILVMVFLAVAVASAAFIGYFMPQPAQARLKKAIGQSSPRDDDDGAAWTEKIVTALSPAGKLSQPAEGWENSTLRRQFMRAGIRNDRAILFFFATKTLLALALPALFMFSAGISHVAMTFNNVLMAVVGLAALGYYAPNLYLRHRVRVRQREVFEKLPDAIDLMTVMVEAGLGLDAAIGRVGQEIRLQSPVLEEEFHLVGLELRAGAGREQALRNLALRTGVEEMDLLVSMLVQTDRFGTSMAEALRVHSESLRTKRRLRVEEEAAKISLKLLFPLVFCIFPAIMIVLLGPAVISIYRGFIRIAS
ncbi:MAG: type II secretion system protein [Betaproteobacteria bacterium RIFCSPLOWO2_02_FULL_65_24]|nr:MAG: type II secretion system protein [Betaproteobacteria bacterium RIFCSPLOWO2_02_FULL_65_24]OGA34953.1 MAG: type II secretion system protein [Betaproteobacteria bacterium RIFCSPLOWO2_12_FULL_62_13b]